VSIARGIPLLILTAILGLAHPGSTALAAGTTERVSLSGTGTQADAGSYRASLSADGRYVAFESSADNLVPGDTNGTSDIFVRDRVAGTTERVSVSSLGHQGCCGSEFPSISANGRYVAFLSRSDLGGPVRFARERVYVRDRTAGITTNVDVTSTGRDANGDSYWPAISADGHHVAFESNATNLACCDVNYDANDVFVRNLVAHTTELISVNQMGRNSGNGWSENPSISADGRYVAFQSTSSDLIAHDTDGASDVFVRDRSLGTTERVSVSSVEAQEKGGGSGSPSISGDGRYVAFGSSATNLVAGDTNSAGDVFLRDRSLGKTKRVSVSSTGQQGNAHSSDPAMSADGSAVAFWSSATNLTSDTWSGSGQIFVRYLVTGVTKLASVSSTGAGPNDSGVELPPGLSSDGLIVGFDSQATNLVPGDTNGASDVFVHISG